MINYDTIISAYKDRPTLMQWLKKVEKALNDVSATSFSVVKKGNATISFKIDFADGSSLESGDIILQQGESVQSAAIVNGHLILTLSNGDELDAGNLGAVSGFSIDASQHLIVTYQDGTTNDLGAIFNGNVNISGILSASSISVSGDIEASHLLSDNFLKPKTPVQQLDIDLNMNTSSTATAYGTGKIDYSHARISNGKLNIVVLASFKCETGFTATSGDYLLITGSRSLTSADLVAFLADHLQEVEGTTGNYRSVAQAYASVSIIDSTTGTLNGELQNASAYMNVLKRYNSPSDPAPNAIGIELILGAKHFSSYATLTAGKTYVARCEVNLIL